VITKHVEFGQRAPSTASFLAALSGSGGDVNIARSVATERHHPLSSRIRVLTLPLF